MLVLLAATALAADQQILFVGNSYTAYNELHVLVSLHLEAGDVWAPAETTAVTRGGHTLPEHLADANNPAHPLYGHLHDGGTWDTVILQDQSQIPGFPDYIADKSASLDAVVDLDALIAPTGARTMFFLTWGRRDGDGMNPWLFPDYVTMQDLLTDGYREYHAAIDRPDRRAYIAPVGEAWRTVHGDVLAAGGDPTEPDSDFVRLYAADGSHPSPYGSFLIAGVFHAALTGRSPVGLGLLADDLVDDRYRTYLEEVAARTVLDDPWAFPLPWAFDLADLDGDVISDPGMWLLVRAADADSRDALTVATDHDGDPGSGRLWVTSGGALTVTDLTIGPDGLVAVDGGALTAGTLAGPGALTLDDGTATLGPGAVGSLVQAGGVLTAALDVSGDFAQTGGTWTAVDGAALTVGGSADLSGSIDVSAVTAPEHVVLTAGALTVDLATIVARADQEIVIDEAGGTIAVTSAGTGTGGTTPSTTGTGTGGGTGTGATGGTATGATATGGTGGGTATGGATTSDDPVIDSGGTGKDTGCGCATGGAPVGAAWVLLLALVRRRMR